MRSAVESGANAQRRPPVQLVRIMPCNLPGANSAPGACDRRMSGHRTVAVSCSRRHIPSKHSAEPDADPVDHSDQKNAAALRAPDGDPEIAFVVKEPHQTKNNGGGWHTDHSYDYQPALV